VFAPDLEWLKYSLDDIANYDLRPSNLVITEKSQQLYDLNDHKYLLLSLCSDKCIDESPQDIIFLDLNQYPISKRHHEHCLDCSLNHFPFYPVFPDSFSDQLRNYFEASFVNEYLACGIVNLANERSTHCYYWFENQA